MTLLRPRQRHKLLSRRPKALLSFYRDLIQLIPLLSQTETSNIVALTSEVSVLAGIDRILTQEDLIPI